MNTPPAVNYAASKGRDAAMAYFTNKKRWALAKRPISPYTDVTYAKAWSDAFDATLARLEKGV